MKEMRLTLGDIEYEDTGGDGPPVVFLHGLAMDGSVWRKVIPRLSARYRCLTPLLPVGAHRIPILQDRPLSPRSVALMVGEFIERLALQDVTLVETDGGRAQTLAAARPELISRLVLVSCEAFDNYPPGVAGKILVAAAALPGGISALLTLLRIRALRRLPTAYGHMTKRPIPDEITDRWLQPLFENWRIRTDLRRYLRGARPNEMVEAAESLRTYPGRALVIWAREDKMMPLEHGRRLASLIPNANLLEIADAYTLISEDQPEALSSAISEFLDAEAAPRHSAEASLEVARGLVADSL